MKKRGFTLVELLVVIAIIGLLASIIIVSLNAARNRAKNSAIKSALDQLRLAAEWTYDQTDTYEAVCKDLANDISDAAGTDFKRILDTIIANGDSGTGRNCYDSSTQWCARVTNMPHNDEDWCVDYTGYSGSTYYDCDTNYTCADD